MTPKIFLQLLQAGDGESSLVRWLFVSCVLKDGVEISGSGSFKAFCDIYTQSFLDKKAGKQKKLPALYGLLPGLNTSYLLLDIPTKNKQQMWQALPFMVEEYVAEDIEVLSLGANIQPSGKIRVLVTQKILLEQWLKLAVEFSFEFDSIIGVPDALTPESRQLLILMDGNVCLYKSDNYCLESEFLDIDGVFTILSMESIERIKIILSPENRDHVKAAKKLKIEQEADGAVTVDIEEVSGRVLDEYLSVADFSLAGKINILASGLSSSGNPWLQVKAWRPVALLVLFLAISQIALNLSSGYYFYAKGNKLLEKGEVYYKKLFPDEIVSDLSIQWTHKLEGTNVASQTASFPYLFTVLFDSIESSTKGVNVDLTQFRYDRENGDLRVDVQLPSIAVLDQIKKVAAEKGVSIEIISAVEEKDKTNSSIRVSVL